MADITFMALHGSIGENGKLQATFDNLGIKYTGPNSLGCTLSMNKLVTKQIFKTSGVPTPRGTSLTVKTKDTRLDELGYYLPLVVKPCSNGSSIGVYICHTEEDYYDAIHKSFDIDNTDEVVIEPFIKGREFTDVVIDGEAYPVVQIAPREGFYDYKNKYQAGSTEEICPAPISKELTERIQDVAKAAYKALRLKVYARMDFIVDDKEQIYCLEANTLPGMTPTSLIPQEAAAVGIGYEDLCQMLVELSLAKYE